MESWNISSLRTGSARWFDGDQGWCGRSSSRVSLVILVFAASCSGQSANPVDPSELEPTSRAPAPDVETSTEEISDGASPTDDASAVQPEDGSAEPVAGEHAAEPSIAEASLENAGAEVCVVEDTRDVVSSTTKRMADLKIAFGPGGGLLAWPRDTKNLAVVALDSEGVPASDPRVVEMSLAHGLYKIVPVGGRFLVLTEQYCLGTPYHKIADDRCTFARVFGSDGQPLGEEVGGNLGPYPAIRIVEVRSNEVYLTRTVAARGFHDLYRYTIEQDGAIQGEVLDRLEVAVEDAHSSGDTDAYSSICDVVDDRLVVLLTEANLRYRVTSKEGRVHLLGLVSNAWVQKCTTDEEGMVLIFNRGELPRRHLARFGHDGRLREPPTPLKAGEPAPAPFISSFSFGVSVTKVEGASRWRRKIFLRRRMVPFNDEVGQETLIADDLVPDGGAEVAWTGERFVVAHTELLAKGMKLRLSRVRCSD